MKKSTHPALIRFIRNVIDDIPIHSSGTYNRMDPTAWEKGEKEFKHNGMMYKVTIHDVTWGVEIVILKIQNNKETRIGGLYLNRAFGNSGGDEVIWREDSRGALPILVLLNRHVFRPDFISYQEQKYIRESSEEYFPDPMGCLSDYE